MPQVGVVERLGQKTVDALVGRLDSTFERGVACEHDATDFRVKVADGGQGFHPVYARHLEIGDHNGDGGRIALDDFHGLPTVFGHFDAIALPPQGDLNREADALFVIHD